MIIVKIHSQQALRPLLVGILALLLPCKSMAYCFEEAAKSYSVPAMMLKAIAKTETNMVSTRIGPTNLNGSYDIGLMQINSSHLGVLSRYGINQETLLGDPCLNVKVGAWILQKNFIKYGETWRAVGAYNAGDEAKRALYAQKVAKNYASLSGMSQPSIFPPLY